MNKPMSYFSAKKQDASTPTFWDERFINKVMSWDKGGVPADLQRYFQHAKPEPCHIRTASTLPCFNV